MAFVFPWQKVPAWAVDPAEPSTKAPPLIMILSLEIGFFDLLAFNTASSPSMLYFLILLPESYTYSRFQFRLCFNSAAKQSTSPELIWLQRHYNIFRLFEAARPGTSLLNASLEILLFEILSLQNLGHSSKRDVSLSCQSSQSLSPRLLYSMINWRRFTLRLSALKISWNPSEPMSLLFISSTSTLLCSPRKRASSLAPSSPMKRSLKTTLRLSRRGSNWEAIDIQIEQRLQGDQCLLEGGERLSKRQNCQGHSYIIEQEQMGCGALCGEGAQAQSGQLAHLALTQVVGQLKQSSGSMPTEATISFLQKYQEKPESYILVTPTQLTKGQPVPYNIMEKWKCLLFSLDCNHKNYQKCLGVSNHNQGSTTADEDPSLMARGESTLLFHDSFPQIEKDLERTFSLPEGRKGQFENVLKRIANHFPKMGYTQGINFIIGYLIIIGYSEDDSFWTFVHIATNRRYLLLGLYEDGFPLSNACTHLFTNIIHRKHPQLHNHLFEELMVDPSMWVFKWFMTCFLYSFPFQMIQHVWDILIQVGNLGLVAFAISLTLQLSPSLLNLYDLADISFQLAELKNIETFNKLVNLKRVVKRAYQMDFMPTDFRSIQEMAPFYGEIIKKTSSHKAGLIEKSKELPRMKGFPRQSEEIQTLLKNWYQQLTDERIIFKTKRQSTLRSANIPLQIESIPKIRPHSREEINKIAVNIVEPAFNHPVKGALLGVDPIDVEEERSPTSILSPPQAENSQEFGKIGKMGSTSTSTRQIPKRTDLIIEQIFESNESQVESAQSSLSKSSKLRQEGQEELDELDRFSMEFDSRPKRNSNPFRPKIPSRYFKRNTTDDRHLPASIRPVLMAGKNMFKEDSYDAISISSKNSRLSKHTNPPSRSPKNSLIIPIQRSCNCKTKTQENKVGASFIEPHSQEESSKDQFSETHSIGNAHSLKEEEINDSLQNFMKGVPSNNMINSHGPKPSDFMTGTRGKELRGTSKGEGDMQRVEVLPFKKSKMGKDSRVSHIEITSNKANTEEVCMECNSKSIESMGPAARRKESQAFKVQVESTC